MNWATIWEAVAALAGWTMVVGAFLYLVVKLTIRDEISKINGIYLRAQGSQLTGSEIERRLDRVEERVEDIKRP